MLKSGPLPPGSSGPTTMPTTCTTGGGRISLRRDQMSDEQAITLPTSKVYAGRTESGLDFLFFEYEGRVRVAPPDGGKRLSKEVRRELDKIEKYLNEPVHQKADQFIGCHFLGFGRCRETDGIYENTVAFI